MSLQILLMTEFNNLLLYYPTVALYIAGEFVRHVKKNNIINWM